MNKLRKSILWTILALFLPMTQAWAGGGSTTYYAALTAQVSSKSSGMGTVYAGTSNTAGSATYSEISSASQNSTTQGASKTFYAFAKANEGYEFKGWSASENGMELGTNNPLSQTVKCSSDNSSNPTTTTLYATFAKIVLREFAVTFLPSTGGSYTVDGVAAADKTGLTEAYKPALKATPSAGYRLYGWYVQNGASKEYFAYTADATYTALSAVQIGVDFIPESEVVKVTDFEALQTALAASSPVVEIASTETVVVPSGKTLTVPAGKKLTVAGKLAVMGTLNVVGLVDGSGKVLKISKIISQGEIQTLYMANGNECPKITESHHERIWPKYRKTTVQANTPSLTGNAVSCATTGWGVYCNGKVTSISKQSPVAVKVNVNTANAVNDITSVVENGDVDSINAQGAYVMFDDCSITGPAHTSDASRLNFSGTVDCAGKVVTFGLSRTYSDFAPIILNGTVDFQPKTDFQNAAVLAFNCSSVTVKNIKGTCPFYYYDCGSSLSPSKLTYGYNSTPGTRKTYFYGGVYTHTFDSNKDTGNCNVYGGSFTTDPTAYIPSPLNDELYAPKEGNYFVVQPKPVAKYVVSVGDTKYESLEDALENAPAGSTIMLIEGVDLTDKTITVAGGKQVTIDLNKHLITGGKIVNNGTLVLTDYATANESTVGADIENNGTLDFIFGTYSGDIVNKAGTLTIHNGAFNGRLSSDAGTLDLKGGHFAQDVTEFVTAEKTQVFVFGDKYYVCEMPNGTFYAKTVSGVSGYGVTPYTETDYNLLKKYVDGKKSRVDYSDSDWTRLAELLPFYEVYNNRRLDATLVFDRNVAANSLEFNVQASITLSRPLDADVAAGEKYRALSAVLAQNGWHGKTYYALWDDSIQEVAVSFSNKSSVNVGTLCTLMVELWETERAKDYTTSNGHMVSNTVCVAGKKQFVIGAGTNKAMTRPETGAATFYPTLAAAVENTEGQVILLTADDNETLAISKACVIDFDPNGFAFTGAIAAGDGYELTTADLGDGRTRYTVAPAAVAQVGGDKFTSLDDALAAAQTSGEPVLVLGVPPEAAPEGFKPVSVDGKTLLVPETAPEVVVQAPAAANFPEGVALTAKDEVVAAGPVAVITGTGVLEDEVCAAADVLAALQAAAETEAERTQITAESEIRRYVSVQLTAVPLTDAGAFAGLSFDVKPMAKTFVIDAAGAVKVVVAQIPNDALKGGITFRLPLTDAFTASARVTHTDDPDRLVKVEKTDGKRYAAITATHFSIFTAYPDSHVESAVSSSNVLAVKRVPGIDGAAAGTEVVAAVPWKNVALTADVTVDRLIATGVATGDEIAAWNHGNKTYYTWRFNGTSWESAKDAKTGLVAPAASETTLARGTAVWYKRATPSAAYSQVGGYTAEAVATTVTLGGKTLDNKPANTLLINPYYETVDLARIDGGHGDQIQVLSSLKVYSCNNGQWGVVVLEEVDSPFGPIKQQKFNAVNSIELPAGEGFWYISKGGQPTIGWKAIKPTAE